MMNFVYSALETSDVVCLLIDATEKFGHGDEFVLETLRKVKTPVFLLIIRYHVSSGTTGKPTVVGYTQNDLNSWTTSLARALTSIGLGRGDVIQVSYGYGLFTGGLGLHYGAERIGATVLPTSVGNTERQIV